MLRFLIRNFSRQLKIRPKNSEFVIEKFSQQKLPLHKIFHRALATEKIEAVKQAQADFLNPIRQLDDDEYLMNSQLKVRKHDIWDELKAHYRMRECEIERLLNQDLKFKNESLKDFSKLLKILLKNGISKHSILENPWILTIRHKLLITKLIRLQDLQFYDINDFVPFLRVSSMRLQKLIHFMTKDAKNFPGYQNRVYYIADRLHLEPIIVTRYLCKRLFVLEMPLEQLLENLNNMIDFGIKPMSILKDLWAFRYKPSSVKARLERAKDARKDKIMPWMVRCPEKILQKSLKLSVDEKKLLGSNSVEDYVASRLGYNVETTRAIMLKHPAVFKVRVTKIKEVLDYLLDEVGYCGYEIAQAIRIICHSLDTTKKRLEELKSYGCTPSSLVLVCRSKREYEKFIRNWLEVKEKLLEKKDETNSVGICKIK